MLEIKHLLEREKELIAFHSEIKLEGVRLRIEAEKVKEMWLEEPGRYENFLVLAYRALDETANPEIREKIKESIKKVEKSRESLTEGWQDLFSG